MGHCATTCHDDCKPCCNDICIKDGDTFRKPTSTSKFCNQNCSGSGLDCDSLHTPASVQLCEARVFPRQGGSRLGSVQTGGIIFSGASTLR